MQRRVELEIHTEYCAAQGLPGGTRRKLEGYAINETRPWAGESTTPFEHSFLLTLPKSIELSAITSGAAEEKYVSYGGAAQGE